LATAGLVGFRVRTRVEWGRPTVLGFAGLVAGLTGAVAGSVAYVAAGLLSGWTLSVWAYFLALVGATVFGIGLLGDGTFVPVGPGTLLGAGVAALGWWT
jgi:hypothetical protein